MTKNIISLLLIFTLAFFISGCVSTKKSEKIILRLANNHVEGYPTSVACDEFARLVNEKSDGRIVIETYHGAVLGDEKSTIEQVQIGGIDFARVSIANLAEIESSLNALQLPYLYRNEDHMWKVLDGDVGKGFLESDKLKGKGIVGLNWYSGGSRNIYNSKKEVKTPDDLKGMKIRVQESVLMMGLILNMGAEPVPMPFEDVYSSIQTGTIDGAENNWPSYISTGHYEVAKYYTVNEHTRVPEMIVASKKTMDKLSDKDQEIIKECAKMSTQIQIKLWKEYEKEAEKEAKEAGCVITYLDADQLKLFQQAVTKLNQTEGAKYIDVLNKISEVK